MEASAVAYQAEDAGAEVGFLGGKVKNKQRIPVTNLDWLVKNMKIKFLQEIYLLFFPIAMQISEKEEDDNEKREDPGDNWEEGGGGGGTEKSSGPWNKAALVQAPPAPVIVTETPETAMTSGVHRPPGARLTTTRKTPQGPPEIYSDTQFPSLQSTAKHVESRNRDKEMEKSFEVVRHKNRGRDEVSKNQVLKLQLDNQYVILKNQKCSHTQSN
ncbi:CDV3-like protein [Heterocephalus glaber]|uniref:CDV3-like protein n=1 Tax=Heterocephalus glaber TaxID=10181 RepID=G5BG06_HETGA|nr:CDV3-like protein [Heterocephalus glaber]